MQSIAIDTAEESNYYSTLQENINVANATLVVTKQFQELMSTVECVLAEGKVTSSEMSGVMISGPKGTGKSMSFLYLYAKLKEKNIPLLIISPSFESVEFLDYLNWFSGGNSLCCWICFSYQYILFFLYTIENTTSVESAEVIIKHILTSSSPAITKRFLFVEMGPVTKQVLKSIITLLTIADIAFQNQWFIILSVSSGLGWKNIQDSADQFMVTKYMWRFRTSLYPVKSKNFTTEEAVMYMNYHNIDSNKWESKLSDATNRNPLLLLYFKHTRGSKVRFDEGLLCLKGFLYDLAHDLVESMKTEVFTATMNDCHMWLVFAVQETPIPIAKREDYISSYIAMENLTYVCKEESDIFYTEQSFPMFYAHLMQELLSQFNSGVDAVLKSPIVQGLAFESRFLQSNLHDLHIRAINKDGCKNFYFPIFSEAQLQEDSAVTVSYTHLTLPTIYSV